MDSDYFPSLKVWTCCDSKTAFGSKTGHNLLTFSPFYTICDYNCFLESKLLSSLLSEESTLQTLCYMLDAHVRLLGDYRVVAQYYGFEFYQIMSVLGHGQATYPGEPTRTRALIESLACSHPDLTVEEFATVVEREAKRKDVSRLLRAYDMAEEATEEL